DDTFTVSLGNVDPHTGAFVSLSGGGPHTPDPDALRVDATRRFGRFFSPGESSVSASAVGTLSGEGGFALGSFVARLNSDESAILNPLFSGLLGSSLNLTLVGYQGMASGQVTLGELLATGTFSAGTVSELLDADITLAHLFQAGVLALTNRGGAASLAAATPLGTLAAHVNSSLHLRLGDLIKVAQGSNGAAADAELNVLDLASMATQVADGDHFVDLTLPVIVPGVATARLRLMLIEPPQIAIGPARLGTDGEWVTRAKTAQVRARLDLRLASLLLGLATVNLPIYLEGGGAEAALVDTDCSEPFPHQEATIEVTTRAVSSYIGSVGETDLKDTTTPVSVGPAALVNLDLLLTDITVSGSADAVSAATTQDVAFTKPWDWDNTETVGASSLGLGNLLRSDLSLSVSVAGLGLTVNSVRTALLGLLNPLLTSLDTELLAPLGAALGLRLGGADVTAFSLDCEARRLVG
ncbi:MAG: hypothetical protein ACRDV9_03415, partial [Acidimicrobiia bacterium]